MFGKLSPRVSLILGGLIGIGVFFVSLSSVLAATDDVNISATVPAICGNSTVEGSEECDDGNTTSGDGCSATCVVEEDEGGGTSPPPPPPAAQCGNGVVETGEQCDDGNQVSGDGCSGACQLESQPPAICGNGTVEGSEQCDDGNQVSGDGCSSSCTIETGPVCGNSVLESGEQCDDGNLASGDGCSSACQIELPPAVCGNGQVEGAEQCDDGNQVSGDGCSASCVIEAGPACGNGQVEGSEQCDDGNLQNGDGCSSSCQAEVILGPTCGNGLVETGEQCDDNNTISGDGCSSSCQTEGEVPPTGEPGGGEEPGGGTEGPSGPGGGTAPAMCGNAIVETGEQCDDGNQVSGDGCSRNCRTETVTESVKETAQDIRDIISGEGSVGEKVTQVANQTVKQITDVIAPTIRKRTKEVGQTIQQGVKKVNELADNPEVERVTKDVVAPTVVITAVATVTPSLFSILFPLLRFLFLQPLLIFGRRKREEWGMVYNALDKVPIDLAIVRLINTKTNTLVRSRVTDKKGRYLFSVPAGEYRIEVTKNGFLFPSELLKNVSADGRLLDLYHGEYIVVKEDSDAYYAKYSAGSKRNKSKNTCAYSLGKTFRVVQHSVSLGGIIATAISLYIKPSWEIWLFLGVHVVLYTLFLRYVQPKKPKDWGIVYDISDKAPVGRAVARLFSKQYNKLVATKITDAMVAMLFWPVQMIIMLPLKNRGMIR